MTIHFEEIPPHQTDAMCRTLIGCVNKYFEDPAVAADYDRWKQERQKRIEDRRKNEKEHFGT